MPLSRRRGDLTRRLLNASFRLPWYLSSSGPVFGVRAHNKLTPCGVWIHNLREECSGGVVGISDGGMCVGEGALRSAMAVCWWLVVGATVW